MEFTAEMIAGLIGGRIEGDAKAAVHTVSSIEGGHKGSLTYLTNPKYEPFVYTTGASIVLVGDNFEPKAPVAATLIKVPDVNVAVLHLLEIYNAAKPARRAYHPARRSRPKHPSARIATSVTSPSSRRAPSSATDVQYIPRHTSATMSR